LYRSVVIVTIYYIYGLEYKDVLYDLYRQRKALLEEIGINISFEQLLSYY